MQNLVIAHLTQTQLGIQVNQQGSIIERINSDFTRVALSLPTRHQRLLSAAALSEYVMFESNNDFAAFMDALTPKPAALSAPAPEATADIENELEPEDYYEDYYEDYSDDYSQSCPVTHEEFPTTETDAALGG